jgi:hypothetical protein
MLPRRSLTLERRPLLKNRLLLCLPTTTTSTSATSASSGYRLLGVHTGLYSSHNMLTFTTLKLRGVSTRRLLPSASTPVSSCAVPLLRLCGDVRVCVLCVWGGGASLLGCRSIRVRVPSLYICIHHPYAIQSSSSLSYKFIVKIDSTTYQMVLILYYNINILFYIFSQS